MSVATLRRSATPPPMPAARTGTRAPIRALEKQLADVLGLDVAIKYGPKGSTSHRYDPRQLDDIVRRLRG
jgi:hypothetical protein